MNYNPDKRISELGLELPPAPKPAGLYKPALVIDKYLYVSGHGPLKNDGTMITGRVGKEFDRDGGKIAARQVGLAMLSTLKATVGDLSKIKRIVKVLGMVNCTPEFDQHPYVINGFSELMADVFGPDNGVAARSAVGMILPGNTTVEVEAIFELY